MFKKVKASLADFNGYPCSDADVQEVIDDFDGDIEALLEDIGRPAPSYTDDSWGDYETGDFY